MHHVAIQHGEVTNENLQQTCESIALAHKVMMGHWDGYIEGLEQILNERGVPTDEKEEAIQFLKHSVTLTIETVHLSVHAMERLATYAKRAESGVIAGASDVQDALHKAVERVDAADSDEEMAKIMADWDFTGAADDMEDQLAMETGALIPPSIERSMRDFIKNILGDQVKDEDIVIEPLETSGRGWGVAFAAMPSPAQIVAKTNQKRLDRILRGTSDEEKEENNPEKA